MIRWIYGQGYVLMVITALLWAGNIIVGRGIHHMVPPIGLNFWRWVPTVPILLVLAWPHLSKDWPVVRRHWRWMVFYAGLAISGFNSFIYIGLEHTAAVNTLLINSSRPAIIVLLSFVMFQVSVRQTIVIGLICGLLGTATIILRGDLSRLSELRFNPGDLWIFTATVTWALYTVLLPRRPSIHPASFLAFSVIIGLLQLLPFYVWETLTIEPFPFTRETIAAILFLALFSSIIAHLSYTRVVELLGANRAGTISYLILSFGVLMAILLLGETFESYHSAGLVLLVTASWLVARPTRS